MKPILNLTIQRKWLDMIAAGVKREEYRAPNCPQLRDWERKRLDYYHREKRLAKPAIYRAGYCMDSPALVVEVLAVVPPVDDRVKLTIITDYGSTERHRPEWGEPKTPHYTIVLGEVRKTGTYTEVKKWMEER